MQYLHFDWTKASGTKNGRESVERLLSVARKSLSILSLEVTTMQYTLPFFRLQARRLGGGGGGGSGGSNEPPR